MQARLKRVLLTSLAAIALPLAALVVTYLATPLASHAVLVSVPSANSLWHPVLLKPDEEAPDGVSARERRSIEEAVRTQIRAYVARDAMQAFTKLAPSTQRFFGEPDKFLRSIAQEIPAMLDTRRLAFLGMEQVGERIVEQVLITDSMGQEWLAEFELEQLNDGDWRIKGCVVQSTPGQQA
jgi:hypothetical protein